MVLGERHARAGTRRGRGSRRLAVRPPFSEMFPTLPDVFQLEAWINANEPTALAASIEASDEDWRLLGCGPLMTSTFQLSYGAVALAMRRLFFGGWQVGPVAIDRPDRDQGPFAVVPFLATPVDAPDYFSIAQRWLSNQQMIIPAAGSSTALTYSDAVSDFAARIADADRSSSS
jgi:hypothetical protein